MKKNEYLTMNASLPCIFIAQNIAESIGNLKSKEERVAVIMGFGQMCNYRQDFFKELSAEDKKEMDKMVECIVQHSKNSI